MIRKTSTLTASLVILQTILLLTSISLHVDAYVVTITLATARDYRGWGSGSTDLTLIIPVKGINVAVKVSFQGGDAYYVIAAALVANYDYQRGKYISFSGGYTTTKKDYTGVLGWDSYTWSPITTLYANAKIVPSCPQGQSFTIVSYNVTQIVESKYCTWWGASCTTRLELLKADATASVACWAL